MAGDAQVTTGCERMDTFDPNLEESMLRSPTAPGPVATMLHPAERQRVDAAGEGLYATIHRENLAQVLCDLKEQRISAVVVSAARCDNLECGRMAAVVREFPRVPTVAILSDVEPTTAKAVLALGNCGVKSLVDVRSPRGWHQLRTLLSTEFTADIEREMLAVLRTDLEPVPPDCWQFFEAIFSPASRIVRPATRAVFSGGAAANRRRVAHRTAGAGIKGRRSTTAERFE